MERIIERINRRDRLIAKLLELQKVDKKLIGKPEPVKLTNEIILRKVLKVHRTDFDSVFWKHKATGEINRKRENVKIRQMYYYLCKKLTDDSLKRIGHIKRQGRTYKVFDHSTIISGIKSHEDLIEWYKDEKKFNDSVIKYLQI